MLKPFKFIVQPVLLEMDEAGEPVGEKSAEPVALYGLEQLAEFAANFEQHLAAALEK